MPPNPKNVEATIELSEEYHGQKATIDFYTNSAVAIGRNREDPDEGVWLDNWEKRVLYEALKEQLEIPVCDGCGKEKTWVKAFPPAGEPRGYFCTNEDCSHDG